MFGSRIRFGVVAGTLVVAGLVPLSGRAATPGAYADAGQTLYARYGALCNPSHPTATTWRIGMYRDPGGGFYSSTPYTYTTGYYVTQQKVVGGRCVVTDVDDRSQSAAATFTFANDLSGGELAGPTKWGNVHVVWSGSATPQPDAGPYYATPPTVDAGVYAFADRPMTGTVGLGSTIHYPAAATNAIMYLGAEGGAYDA